MKKSTKALVVAGGVAASVVGLTGLVMILSAKKASLSKPAPSSKKETSSNPLTPGATKLPTSGKQAIPDPWTPVEWQPKMWPVWWPDRYRPW